MQVYCLDFNSSSIPSSQFSVDGGGHENESVFVSDYIRLFYYISPCLPHHISWALVHWSCFTCCWKEARDLDYFSKLCCKEQYTLSRKKELAFFFFLPFILLTLIVFFIPLISVGP